MLSLGLTKEVFSDPLSKNRNDLGFAARCKTLVKSIGPRGILKLRMVIHDCKLDLSRV